MNNISKIRERLTIYDCRAVLILDAVNRFYATGFNSSAGALLITLDNAWFFTDSRYIEAAKSAVREAHVELIDGKQTYIKQVKKIFKDNNITTVGFESSRITHEDYLILSKELNVELTAVDQLIDELRNVKSQEDLDKMIRAQRLSERVFDEILPLISTDITEKQLAAELIYRMLKNGADDTSFSPVIVSGKKSSMPHGVPGNEYIRPGFLTIDFGVRLGGWCSDTTRTLCIGKPDDEMINVYDTVLRAQTAGIGAIRSGVRGIDVDTAARSVISDAGYGEFFGHGFGHSIGLEVHETLKASSVSKDILPAGAVLSAEPGIYLQGKYGVRIEDVVFVTHDGCQNITSLPKDLIVI